MSAWDFALVPRQGRAPNNSTDGVASSIIAGSLCCRGSCLCPSLVCPHNCPSYTRCTRCKPPCGLFAQTLCAPPVSGPAVRAHRYNSAAVNTLYENVPPASRLGGGIGASEADSSKALLEGEKRGVEQVSREGMRARVSVHEAAPRSLWWIPLPPKLVASPSVIWC